MRRAILIFVLLLALAPPLLAHRVVDRIVARIEDDIIVLSEVRELGRFQQLVEGRSVAGQKLLEQLIEQWIVSTEAEAARFPRPAAADVDRELVRLEEQSGGAQAFRGRLRTLGLSRDAVRRQLARQLWLSRYLDYKFRPAAQVDDAQVERYYRTELAPNLTARGEKVSPLADVREQIRELLIQRDITARAGRWLEETRPRLRIEIQPGELNP
jgi:hypothetical protein